MEGAGRAAYFRCFGKLIADQQQWPFAGRVKRPPTEPMNALLSFGYALLASKVASAVQMVGFDPFVGYLHTRPLFFFLLSLLQKGIVEILRSAQGEVRELFSVPNHRGSAQHKHLGTSS
jgi:hypothetical protein